jgi:hypothetical protein
VLSGTVTEEMLGYSKVASHHFLPKPCNVRRLTTIIHNLVAAGDGWDLPHDQTRPSIP